ncbi:tonsoku-like protein [Rhinoraja longicauda]
MLKILQLQEGASSMDLTGLQLGTARLGPLLRSLRLHIATQELRLAATQLALPAMGELLATLHTLPKLTLLDLSDNLINGPGLRELSQGAHRSTRTPFPSLRELNLSLNPLGAGSGQGLALLLECCPLLSTLRLRGCRLTAAVLQHPALNGALRGCPVKTLEVSGNPLGCLGLHPLARTLRHFNLTHLHLDGITTLPRDGNLTQPLLTYLGQGNNTLTHLSLADNHLNDSSAQQLASCIPYLSSLAYLDLSQNPGLGSPGLQLLLEALEKRDCCLQVLDLSGCSVKQQGL